MIADLEEMGAAVIEYPPMARELVGNKFTEGSNRREAGIPLRR